MAASANRDAKLVVGGESRIELLPPEVAQRSKARSTRRLLAGVVVLALLVAGGSSAFAGVISAASAARLESEQAKTSALLKQQQEFVEVQLVEDHINTIKAAREVSTATEVDWQDYLAKIQAQLPSGVALTGFLVDSGTPLEPFAEPTAPLQGDRVAAITFDATSPVLPDVSQWLDGLRAVTGFVDAVPNSSILDEQSGLYEVNITMHISADAYSGRFAPEVSASTEEVEE